MRWNENNRGEHYRRSRSSFYENNSKYLVQLFVITIYTHTPTHPATHTHTHTHTQTHRHRHTHTNKASPHRMPALLYMPVHRGSCESISTQPPTHTHAHIHKKIHIYNIYYKNTYKNAEQKTRPALSKMFIVR